MDSIYNLCVCECMCVYVSVLFSVFLQRIWDLDQHLLMITIGFFMFIFLSVLLMNTTGKTFNRSWDAYHILCVSWWNQSSFFWLNVHPMDRIKSFRQKHLKHLLSEYFLFVVFCFLLNFVSRQFYRIVIIDWWHRFKFYIYVHFNSISHFN